MAVELTGRLGADLVAFGRDTCWIQRHRLLAALARAAGWDRRPPCTGSANVLPVPYGWTAQQSWTEIRTFGYLRARPAEPVGWTMVECRGGAACGCRGPGQGPLPATVYQHWHNGRLHELRLLGIPLPRPLLALASLLHRRNRRCKP